MLDYKEGEVSYTFPNGSGTLGKIPGVIIPKWMARIAEGTTESNFRICPSCNRGGCVELVKWRTGMSPACVVYSGLKTPYISCRSVLCAYCNAQVLRVLLKGKVIYFSNIPEWRVA